MIKKWTAIVSVGLAVMALVLVALPAAAESIATAPAAHRAGPNGDQYLADALGITLDELQAAKASAQDAAREASIQAAVDAGLLTQEQADALRTLEGTGLRGRGFHGFRGQGEDLIDRDALLADALGISVDELQAAKDAAFEAGLADAVTAGRVTEEQAEQIRARRALETFLKDQDLGASMRSLYSDAVQQAVEAGVITQEQADAILSSGMPGFGRGGMRGFEGRGMRGFDGHGMRGGFMAPGSAPQGNSITPTGISL